MEKLLGPTLIDQKEIVETSSAFNNTVIVAIYFGAHWAPPCRLFTEHLLDFHRIIHFEFNNFKVVFVSDDGDELAFQRNYALMPWLALPYSAVDIKMELKKRAGINGIPNLMIVSSVDGEIMVEDACD